MPTAVLSTRLFGALPSARELGLSRRFWFLEHQVDLRDAPSLDTTAARRLREAYDGEGLRVRSVHLTRLAGRTWRPALEFAVLLGAQVVIAHATADDAALSSLMEAAADAGLCVAIEPSDRQAVAPARLLPRLRRLGVFANGGGLCVDLGRWEAIRDEVEVLRPSVRWLEVSSRTGGHAHELPLDDPALHGLVQALAPGFACYEVARGGPPSARPGEAELPVMMARLQAWHLGGGRLRGAPSEQAPVG